MQLISNETITQNALSRIGNKLSAEDRAAIDRRINEQFKSREVFMCSHCSATVLKPGVKCLDCLSLAAERAMRQNIRQSSGLRLWIIVGVLAALFFVVGFFSFCAPNTLQTKPAIKSGENFQTSFESEADGKLSPQQPAIHFQAAIYCLK